MFSCSTTDSAIRTLLTLTSPYVFFLAGVLYQPVRFVSIIFAFFPSEFLILCVLLSFSVCLRCSHCHCSHFPIELLPVSKSRLYHTTLFSVVAVTEIAASSSRHHHLPTHPERRGAPSPNTRGNATFATTTAQAPIGSFSTTLHPHVWSNRYSPSTKQTTNVPNTGTAERSLARKGA